MSVNLPLIDVSSFEGQLGQLPQVPVPDGAPRPAPEERAVVWAAAAVLMGYPDAGLVAALPEIEGSLLAVSPRVGGATVDPLRRLIGWLQAQPLLSAQQDYVATFDTKRRCCPYLTYYLHGDTRRRGLALWRVKSALLACGFEPAGGELPDHLAVLCELGATGDESVAVALLSEHRAGLALLLAALDTVDSPYRSLVEAVQNLLPTDGPTVSSVHATAARLAASGPPAELVGLPGRLAPFLPAGAAADGTDDDRGARR